jgi:hypothetical protein
LGDGGIEVPALFEVLRDPGHRLVGDTDQVAFLVRHSLWVEIPVFGVADGGRVFVDKAENAIQEAP